MDVSFKRASASLPLNTGQILSVTLDPLDSLKLLPWIYLSFLIYLVAFASIIMDFRMFLEASSAYQEGSCKRSVLGVQMSY